MSTNLLRLIGLAAMAIAIAAPNACIAQQKSSTDRELSQKGRALEAGYSEQLADLRTKLRKALPKVSERRKAKYFKALEAEKAAEVALRKVQQSLGEINTAQALVNHAKGKWIGGADRGIAKANALLKKASNKTERDAAQKELVKWQENRKAGVEALAERQAVFDKAKREQPKLLKSVEAAKTNLARSKTRALRATDALGLKASLSRSKLDARLAKFVVLLEATPAGLATFAQQDGAHKMLVERMLADSDLMLQMIVADGAKSGEYGAAMKIYSQIQTASPHAKQGTLQRLALAIALEHAVPLSQRNPTGATDAPATIDPVARYLHYEKALLANELDPGFASLSVWDMRMVVDGNEPDETIAWGREMLRNYRPDHVYTADYRWRYVAAVRTDIRYGSQDNNYDKPELQFFQNILMNGGVCGRRAFFGRFALRAFGVPTTARPQRGHAALAHWTPGGWVVCLGAGWGSGWTKTRYNKDLDFLATTQARQDRAAYLQVKRAQWIGDVVGEKRVFGFVSGTPDFWYGVSLYRQRQIIEDTKAVTLAAVGEELGEANESNVKYKLEAATVTEADREVVVDGRGVITIPAVACSKPTKSSSKVIFMPSNLGGKQLHYSRSGGAKELEYAFNVPKAGRYALTARIVTPSWRQRLVITVNGNKEPVDMPLPHTVGMWGQTDSVEIVLAEGRNVLRFVHKSDGYGKGFSLKDMTLSPME